MKLDKKTISVIKSFSYLNPSIIFRPGQVISTISANKSVVARATIDQSFESRFAIADLKKFLGVISLFKEPEIEIKESSMNIGENGRSVEYRFASEKVVLAPPDKEIDMSDVAVTFTLPAKSLEEIQKALGVLSSPEIAIVGDGEKITLSTFDTKNQTSDTYKVDIGETDKSFRAVFKGETWAFIPQAYEVELNPKKIGRFIGKDVIDITYIVAMNPNSSSL